MLKKNHRKTEKSQFMDCLSNLSKKLTFSRKLRITFVPVLEKKNQQGTRV